jgi:predicted transposase YdaD
MRILEDSPAVRVLGNWGRNQALVEVAENMLRRGRNIQEVAEDTGLDLSRVSELQEELQAPAV